MSYVAQIAPLGVAVRTSLGDYFTLQRGTTYKSRLLGQPGPVLLGLASINRNGGFRDDSLRTYGGDSPDKLLVRPGQLYVSLKDVTQSGDLLGAVARLPSEHPVGRLTQDTVKLEPRGVDVPLDYLYWLLRTPQYRSYCRAHATGTTNLGLPRDDFLAFPAPDPNPAQLRLVEALEALDHKIELNRRMNETLEAMARALYRSWFVDFEPVRAKMEGRWRPGESLPGLPAHLHPLFPDRLVPSELGDIPEGWEMRPLKDFAEVIYGAPFASKRFNDSGLGLPLIRIRDLTTHSPSVFTDEQHPRGQLIKPGDIVVGMDGEFRAYIWQGSPAWLNQRVCHFKPKHGISNIFLLESLTEPLAEFERGKVGTTVIHLGKRDIDSIELRLPVGPAMSAFEQATAGVCDRIVGNAAESRGLTALRDTLLPRLVAGELRMGETCN